MSVKALTLLFPSGEGTPSYKSPDWEYVNRELMKPGVTQQLLWMEYCKGCRVAGEIPFGLTAFKTHYREYAAQKKATMHIVRKPGEIMEVDWAGQTAHLTDTYLLFGARLEDGLREIIDFCEQRFEISVDAIAISKTFFDIPIENYEKLIIEFLDEPYLDKHYPAVDDMNLSVINLRNHKNAVAAIKMSLKQPQENVRGV